MNKNLKTSHFQLTNMTVYDLEPFNTDRLFFMRSVCKNVVKCQVNIVVL